MSSVAAGTAPPRSATGGRGTGAPGRPARRRTAAAWTGAGSALGAGVVAAVLSLAPRAAVVVLALAAVVVLVGLVLLPVHVLPTAALVTAVLVSDRIANFTLAPVISPPAVVLLVWACRRQLSGRSVVAGRPPLTLLVPAGLLVCWTLPLIVISSSPRLGTGWMIGLAVAVLAPLVVRETSRETKLLRTALPWLVSATAGYAVLEALLGRNVLFAPVLRLVGSTGTQHWAVYRAESSYGHPLVAGLVFATVLVLCAGRWLETRAPSFLVLAAVNAAGLISTVSRGSYIAAGAGVVALIGFAVLAGRRISRLRVVLVAAGFTLLVYVAVHSAAFVARGSSDEAAASVVARSHTALITANTARAYHYLGAGPANSLTAATPYNFQGLPIENSYDQLLISLGIPGLLLFCWLLGAMVVIAFRRGNLSAAAALVSFAVGCSGFAALDTRRDLLALLGVLMMLALHPGARPVGGQPVTVTPGR